ncbi:hypothetical protein BV25DRAFT_1603283 [Artomyces pyxidatus]|uniref:Uncharacterized protein n=1 Tax=Artomyces pyxidatus TaxID=48021 RepID=A0ACB8TC40_9AGAM|nr:hypothetical protein BV25DRAFT_1603283 [Artomyces pyxidatus]
MFDRVCSLRQKRPFTGAVVTRQPGNGLSTLMYFFLPKLIAQGHPVVIHTGVSVHLFYFGSVYTTSSTEFSGACLPYSTLEDHPPMWALFDSHKFSLKPEGITSSVIFPVHFTSPVPERFNTWVKLRKGAIFGLRLLTRTELI